MRDLDLLKDMVTRGAAKRYLVKKAFSPTALGVGLQLPGIAHDAKKRYQETLHKLQDASFEPPQYKEAASQGAFWPPGERGGLSHLLQGLTGLKPDKDGQLPSAKGLGAHMGGQMLASGLTPLLQAPSKALGSRMESWMGPKKQFGERKDPVSFMEQKALGGVGTAIGDIGGQLLKDIFAKAQSAIGSFGNQSARDAILKQLKSTDPILTDADDKVLMEAFHTMTRFAPVLSTDKNAVRSFLRQAVMSGNGPDYATIKALADAERAVTGKGKDD